MNSEISLQTNENCSLNNKQKIEIYANVLDRIANVNKKVLDNFCELDIELDAEDEFVEIEVSIRRKKWMSREFAFTAVKEDEYLMDLEEIYGDNIEQKVIKNDREFKKNDVVVCVLDKKKYKGVIFQINSGGLVIKTKDRKKIKIAWGSPEESLVKLVKSKGS